MTLMGQKTAKLLLIVWGNSDSVGKGDLKHMTGLQNGTFAEAWVGQVARDRV